MLLCYLTITVFTDVEVIIGEYSPRRSRGEYSPIITETKVNNCFSIISVVKYA